MRHFFLTFMIFALCLFGCDKTSNPDGSSTDTSKELSVYRTYLNDSLPRLVDQRDSLEALPEEMPDWLMNTGDEFKESTWYTPAAFGKTWPRTITLIPYISKYGSRQLVFNYFSSDWIFVEKLALKAGDDIYTTKRYQYLGNRNYESEVVLGGVYERLQLVKDQDLMKWIANHRDQPIRMKIIGDKGYRKVQLPAAHINYIAESYDIASRIIERFSVKRRIKELAKEIRSNLPTDEYKDKFDEWEIESK